MAAIGDLVHQTSTTTGTGNLTLSAVNGKRNFGTVFGTGGTTNVFNYFISNQSAAEWEVGTGHMSNSTTLVRDTVLASSNSNNAVNFSAGTKDVTNDIPAAQQAQLNTANTWSAQQTFSAALNLTSGQIAFPATAVPSADANTLDDYEEGTWTPVLTFSTPGNLSVAYTSQIGTYTKIGNRVIAVVVILTSTFTHTTASGSLRISGLPFTPASSNENVPVSRVQNIVLANYEILAMRCATDSTFTFALSAVGSAQSPVTVATTHVATGNTTEVWGAGVYRV